MFNVWLFGLVAVALRNVTALVVMKQPVWHHSTIDGPEQT